MRSLLLILELFLIFLEHNDQGAIVWTLVPKTYSVYGLSDSIMAASIEILSSNCSSIYTIQMTLFIKVKVKSGLHDITIFSGSSHSYSSPCHTIFLTNSPKDCSLP